MAVVQWLCGVAWAAIDGISRGAEWLNAAERRYQRRHPWLSLVTDALVLALFFLVVVFWLAVFA